MGELGTIVLADGINVLAAEEGGETSNFLIPNGTFFFVLLIFLIVLGVIAQVGCATGQQGLGRAGGHARQDHRGHQQAAEQVAAAQADSDEAMAGARGEASAIRDEARTEGRKVVDETRAAASGEVAETLQAAGAELSQQGAGHRRAAGVVGGPACRRRWPVASSASTARPRRAGVADVNLHRTADRIRGHRLAHVVKYVVPPVRTHDAEAAGRGAYCSWRKAPRRRKKLDDADEDTRQGASRTPRPRRAPGSPRRRASTPSGSPSSYASRPRPTRSASRRKAHSRFSCCASS